MLRQQRHVAKVPTGDSCTAANHIASQHLDRRRGLFKIAGRQAPAGAELHMQVHLDVEDDRGVVVTTEDLNP